MTATVYVVLPSLNAADRLERSLQSVLSQAGDLRIRCHVQDGGSTDDTLVRLARWQRELAEGRLHLACRDIAFTFHSDPDTGKYDALVRGFERFGPTGAAFMTWIEPGDVLMPGALALAGALERQFAPAQLSWFGGAVCLLRNGVASLSYAAQTPREALRLGLCDGVHLDRVQQAGTFFRGWLWKAADPARTLGPLQRAGAWNLWRLMAERASLTQVPVALAGHDSAAGHTADRARALEAAEIAGLIPDAIRRAAYDGFSAGAALCRRIETAPDGSHRILEETVPRLERFRDRAVLGLPPHPGATAAPAEEATGQTAEPAAFPDIAPLLRGRPGLLALDADWQYPAVTEQHAYHRMCAETARLAGRPLYVAYPWATLIDKLSNTTPDRDLHADRFAQFCRQLPQGVEKVTVCQHIHGRKYRHLFQQAGIRTVFWSHATFETAADPATAPSAAVRFLPFPLYPVQVTEALPEAAPEADAAPRRYLFSFIGARANQHYLTEARNHILEHLAGDPRGLIIGRDSWHYQKIVYDLQVRGKIRDGAAVDLVDLSASDQFRLSLQHSTFSLCPSGSGPNSIRLWESIGAGSIPVILAESWAPPGDRRLWDLAAVFCAEDAASIRALPDRLERIASDPARLAQMRHALRQLWLLYGPQAFVTDVQAFLLAGGAGEETQAGPLPARPESAEAARGLLLDWSARLLADPAPALAALADPAGAAALERALELAAQDETARHFCAVRDHARQTAAGQAAPALGRGAVPKLAFLGRHAHRTPLGYAPIRQRVGDRLAFCTDPAEADLVLSGFNVDWRENAAVLGPLLARTRPPGLVILSEEPLWDVTWSGAFTGREGRMAVEGRDIRYAFLGHETSEVYAFRQIPYFVLTDDRFPVRYAAMMARFAALTPGALLARWSTAPLQAAFFAEKRGGEAYAGDIAERGIVKLSGYRSRIAELAQGRAASGGTGRGAGVLCVGKGWGAEVKRQDLPDWHLDKLAQLDGRVRMATAYENIEMANYISEKIFDAFAMGGIPAYHAGPEHWVFELVPEAAMLNTAGLAPEAAAERILGFSPDAALAEAWLASCDRLARLFGDLRLIQAERQRIADAVVAEMRALA